MKIVEENIKEYLNELDKEVVILQELKEDFIIIDDGTYIPLVKLKRIIKEIDCFGYKACLESMLEEARIVKNYGLDMFKRNFNLVVSVGDGGKRFLNALMQENVFDEKILNLVWHRVWKGNHALGFETDIDKFDFKDKKILLIEDVVASGKSLYIVKQEIERLGGQVIGVISGLINESSPIIKKSFVNILSAKKLVSSDKSLDPFWFPPIYSLRHLIYGDEEMPEIYNEMNEHYFQGNKAVENTIKEIRNEIL